MGGAFFFYAPFPGAYNAPCTGFYIGGISVYPRPIAGLVGLYRGIVEGAIYWGLFLCLLSRVPAPAVVRVRSCWALLRACPCPCGCPPLVEGLHLAPVSLGYPLLGIVIVLFLELCFSVLIVLSSGRGFNDSGADNPGGHTPGGGRRNGASSAGSGLNCRKI